MNNKLSHLLLVLAGCLFIGQPAFAVGKKKKGARYKTTASGLQYSIIKDVKGTQTPRIGDYVEFHIRSHVGDSVIFDSRVMNNHEPVPFQLTTPTFRGDLTEGLMMLTAGDSAIFRIPLDSMLKGGNQMMPWMEAGQGLKMDYEIKIVKVLTPAQLKAERKAAADKQMIIDEKLLKDYFRQNNLAPEKTTSGLYYHIRKPGDGPVPQKGDSVALNYTGRLLNGSTFDSNVDPAFSHVTPFGFRVGMNQVIKGWDEAAMLLPKGTKATLFIPSVLAYGSQSPGPHIPANAIMVFDVEVIGHVLAE